MQQEDRMILTLAFCRGLGAEIDYRTREVHWPEPPSGDD
jgi:hypothetical protein